MADTLATVLVSALTSGVVALGIELVAKPRLEARREAIVGAHRKRQQFSAHLMTILFTSSKWAAHRRPDDLSRDAAQRWRAEMRRGAEAVEEATRAMADDLANVVLGWPTNKIRLPIGRYIASARGIQLSDRSFHEKAELLAKLTGPAHEWLFGRIWRPVSREEARRRLIQELDQIAPYDPAATA